ncbi:hypothetical protein NLG97_g9398 [Lecanicillium saksenae]|uniref:Uncharacterized protein n=1 Tax=Lecanicillium saksenae TaxID=468837 RepID=A0ACC1QIL7_9HYPO|nr:hypothetical protein NLG97_g9398 [Lecanicillium saksenae]
MSAVDTSDTLANRSKPAIDCSVVSPFLSDENGELGLIAKSHGNYLTYGDSAAPSTLWASYARYLQKIIDRVNRNIENTTHTGKIETIRYIRHLVDIDLAVESKLWKAHTDGCLAYIASIGGAQALIELSSTPDSSCSLFIRGVANQSLLISPSHTMWHNMTTPALKHSLGYQSYTDDQFRLIIHEDYFYHEYPFPLELAIIQVHITRLRRRVATTTTITQDELVPIILSLFERLTSVDLTKWMQDIAAFDAATNRPLAEMHRDAIWLYAILALPRAAMLKWALAQPQAPHRETDGDPYDYFLQLYTSRILEAMRALYPTIPYAPALSVALTVVGVALASTGATEDREFVDRCLHDIWMMPVGSDSTYLRQRKLREFWVSGKTGWEECFYEPTPG